MAKLGVVMITREEALRRLDAVAHELVALRAALAEGWTETPVENPTQAFLAKCGGWEDTRSPEGLRRRREPRAALLLGYGYVDLSAQ